MSTELLRSDCLELMKDVFQVDYQPEKKEIRINLPEEVWRNIDTIIMTRLFQEELIVEKQKEGEVRNKPKQLTLW